MVAQLTSNSIKMVGNFRVFVLTSSLLIFLMFSRVLAKDDLGMLRDNHDGLSSSNILLNNFFNFDFLEDLISPKRVGVQINLILSPPSRMDIPSTRIIAALGAASTTADKPTEQPTGQPSIMYVAPTPPEDIVTQMPTTAFNATDRKLSNYPTSQPSTLFIAPTRPEDFLTTMPTAALGSIGQQDSSSPSMKSEGSLPVSGGGVGNRGNVAGAQNIGEELQDEHDTALSSAKYFFLTFLVCLGLFAGIHIIKRRCGPGFNSSADIKPKYSLLSLSDSTEEEDGGFFSNRNLELAHRPPSNLSLDFNSPNFPRNNSFTDK